MKFRPVVLAYWMELCGMRCTRFGTERRGCFYSFKSNVVGYKNVPGYCSVARLTILKDTNKKKKIGVMILHLALDITSLFGQQFFSILSAYIPVFIICLLNHFA